MIDWMLEVAARDGEDDFNSTVTVRRATGATWVTDEYVETTSTVYAGGARVRSQGTNAVVVQAGDRPFTLRTYDVQVPAATAVEVDDHITVDTSRDSQAVGLSLRVIDVPKTEWVTVRNVVAVEET